MRGCKFLFFLRIFCLRWFSWCLYFFLRFEKYGFLIVKLLWLLRLCSFNDIFRIISRIRLRQVCLYIWLCIPLRPLFRLMLFHKELILTLICLLIFVKFLLVICWDSYSLGFNFLNFRFQLLICLWLFKLIKLLLRLMIVKRGTFLKHSSQQISAFELLLDFIIFLLLWNFIIAIIRRAWLAIYW